MTKTLTIRLGIAAPIQGGLASNFVRPCSCTLTGWEEANKWNSAVVERSDVLGASRRAKRLESARRLQRANKINGFQIAAVLMPCYGS